MANPRVCPYLEVLPECANGYVAHAYQAARWLHELDPDLTTPLIRQNRPDYFIFEPAIYKSDTCCIPCRWFKREGAIYANVWPVSVSIIEGVSGLIVHDSESYEIRASHLSASFPYFTESFVQRSMPDPRIIHGCWKGPNEPLGRWTRTNPIIGNKWRARANGHQVFAFPIWLYCDDTSGNQSKKWNKHNSFLFTPAGLKSEHSHKEYNVHFLATSNIAPPLEMLDGIVQQLE